MTYKSKIAIGKKAGVVPVFHRPPARWGWLVLLVVSACLWLQAGAFAQTASQITPPSFRPPPQANTAGVSIPEGSGLEAPAGAEKLKVKLTDVKVEGGLPEMAEATRKIAAGLAHRTVLTYVGADLVVSPTNVAPAIDAASTVAYNVETHFGGQPAPVFFTGQPADSDTQTLVKDPRLDGPAICRSVGDVASVCAIASVQ